jgi:hypothetical protein
MNEARFLAHVEKTARCWYWRGCVGDAGHGIVRVFGRKVSARRAAYELWIGRVPGDSFIGMSCGEKSCVRPSHMVLISPLWVSKLTAAQRSAISRSKAPKVYLARHYGVTTRLVRYIRSGVYA